jgi:hypothetical protein
MHNLQKVSPKKRMASIREKEKTPEPTKHLPEITIVEPFHQPVSN